MSTYNNALLQFSIGAATLNHSLLDILAEPPEKITTLTVPKAAHGENSFELPTRSQGVMG